MEVEKNEPISQLGRDLNQMNRSGTVNYEWTTTAKQWVLAPRKRAKLAVVLVYPNAGLLSSLLGLLNRLLSPWLLYLSRCPKPQRIQRSLKHYRQTVSFGIPVRLPGSSYLVFSRGTVAQPESTSISKLMKLSTCGTYHIYLPKGKGKFYDDSSISD